MPCLKGASTAIALAHATFALKVGKRITKELLQALAAFPRVNIVREMPPEVFEALKRCLPSAAQSEIDPAWVVRYLRSRFLPKYQAAQGDAAASPGLDQLDQLILAVLDVLESWPPQQSKEVSFALRVVPFVLTEGTGQRRRANELLLR